VSPVKYELCSHIPEDGILHSHRRENLKSFTFHVNISFRCGVLRRAPLPDSSKPLIATKSALKASKETAFHGPEYRKLRWILQ
jgi:hypothetical protein